MRNRPFSTGSRWREAEALAVHDAHAAATAPAAMAQEFGDADGSHVPVHAVQVELGFYHPVSAPEPAQHLALQPFAQVGELVAGIERVVHGEGSGKRLGERRALIAQPLPRHRCRAPAVDDALAFF